MRKSIGFATCLPVFFLLFVIIFAPSVGAAVTPALENVNHVRYIRGSDGAFRPDANISRGESAQLIYGLLVEKDTPAQGSFSDVTDQWFAKPVNTLAKMGILKGYGDEFRPTNPITRAEFVTMLCRFFPNIDGENSFMDVSGHWAEKYIVRACAYGWIVGYEDKTFRPNNPIKRAEAVAVVNRALGRAADKSVTGAGDGFMPFIDVHKGSWYYNDVMEATTEHTYTKNENREIWDSFTEPLPSLSVGYHSIEGELYCVKEDGRFARNETTAENLTFNAKGRYTTGNERLDSLLTNAVRENTAAGMTQIEKLRAMYNYLTSDAYYYSSVFEPVYIDMGASNWANSVAVQMLENGRGNCYRYAGTFTLFARKLGYNATEISGLTCKPSSVVWSRHGWVEISVDDQIVICDPEANGSSSRYNLETLFMKKYSEIDVLYRYNDYSGTIGR